MKYLRNIVITIALCGVFAGPASAINFGQAHALAALEQGHQCHSHGYPLWKCELYDNGTVHCWLSVLPSGRGQYLCLGQFFQQANTPLFGWRHGLKVHTAGVLTRWCRMRVRFDREGHRITLVIWVIGTGGPIA